MKSEYRCLVEMIISDERKLAEATKLHAEALERFQKAAETLVAVSKRLDSRRIELSRLDELLDRARPASGGGKAAPRISLRPMVVLRSWRSGETSSRCKRLYGCSVGKA